jgi:phenylacetate-CoA ligase
MVFGYPSALSLIARHAQSSGQRLDDLGVKVVFVTSERLYDEQRVAIEQGFGARVANGYGARDAGFVAHECPHGAMHISAEDLIVEIVDPAGRPLPPGSIGEIAVTHLATRDFPFVRYGTGDVASLDDTPCACGRGLPALTRIQGRTTDFVVARDGTVMHGLALIYTVRDLPGVQKFKIIQHDRDRTEVQIVASPAFAEEHERRIVRDFKARLGRDVAIDVTRVEDIPPEPTGKYRYVVSRVSATIGASVG